MAVLWCNGLCSHALSGVALMALYGFPVHGDTQGVAFLWCLAKLRSECFLAVETALGAVTSSGSQESEPIDFLVFSEQCAEMFLYAGDFLRISSALELFSGGF